MSMGMMLVLIPTPFPARPAVADVAVLDAEDDPSEDSCPPGITLLSSDSI